MTRLPLFENQSLSGRFPGITVSIGNRIIGHLLKCSPRSSRTKKTTGLQNDDEAR